MKTTFTAALVLATMAGTAQAKAWNGADCVALSQPDLKGQSLAVSHDDDATKTTNQLAFAPKSFFIAEGFGVKLFSKENFKGSSEFDGDPSDQSFLHATDGGHYFNVGDAYIDSAASFACVPTGTLVQNANAFHNRFTNNGKAYDLKLPFVIYPGKTFTTTGNDYHGPSASVSFSQVGGHNVLSFAVSYYYVNGYQGTLDLDTSAITFNVIDGTWPHDVLSTQVITQQANVTGIDFQYKGALDSVLDVLDLIITNAPGNGPGASPVTVPTLELNSVRTLLTEGFRTR